MGVTEPTSVLLKLIVNEQGGVTEVVVLEHAGEVFDRAARRGAATGSREV